MAAAHRVLGTRLVAVLLLAAASCDGQGSGGGPRLDPWADLAPVGALVGDVLGMATQMYDGPRASPERDFEIQKLASSGWKRIRISIDWGHVEPARDQFTWERTDPFIAMLTAAGLQVDGRLSYGVDWAAPDDDDSAIEPADFADYGAHVAAHYCGVIESWELWNEENIQRFWQPRPDPSRYGAILKATYTAIHAACPSAKVLIGGLSCFDQYTFHEGLYYFVEAMHEAHPDIGQYFDALAIHPYTFIQTSSPEWSWQGEKQELWPDLPGQIALARQRLETVGAPGKPIWLTEWGWPSLIVGKDGQAKFLARGALLALAAGVEDLDWYTFFDKDGGGFPPTEDYFGLFTWPGAEGGPKEKPSWKAATALSRVLGTSRFAGDLRSALGLPEGAYALAFVDASDGHHTLAAWDSVSDRTTPLTVPAPPGASQHTCVTDLGQPGCAPGGGAAEVTLTDRALYVRFDR